MKRRGAWIAAAVVVVLAVAGLVGFEVEHSQQSGQDAAARRAAQAFVSAWQGGRLSSVAWSGSTGAAMQTEYAAAVAGMGAVKPAVKLVSVKRSGSSAAASVAVSWPLGAGQAWSYTSAGHVGRPRRAPGRSAPTVWRGRASSRRSPGTPGCRSPAPRPPGA